MTPVEDPPTAQPGFGLLHFEAQTPGLQPFPTKCLECQVIVQSEEGMIAHAQSFHAIQSGFARNHGLSWYTGPGLEWLDEAPTYANEGWIDTVIS